MWSNKGPEQCGYKYSKKKKKEKKSAGLKFNINRCEAPAKANKHLRTQTIAEGHIEKARLAFDLDLSCFLALCGHTVHLQISFFMTSLRRFHLIALQEQHC